MNSKIGSPEELRRLRDRVREEVEVRGGPKETRITVHMGTCGIAAGARDVLAELTSSLVQAGVQNVTLRQSGCIGLCDQEPMLTYSDRDGRDYLYVRLDRAKARSIVDSHVLGGRPVSEYIMEE